MNEEDNKSLKSLKEWLKNKKENSVVYIAFGIESTLSQENISHDLSHGIEKFGLPFIWVVKNRPLIDRLTGPNMIPVGFETWVVDRGLVWTGWAPRLKVLAYSSIGEIIESSGEPRHLSIIPLKNFHLFKIAKSVINFCLKKISNKQF